MVSHLEILLASKGFRLYPLFLSDFYLTKPPPFVPRTRALFNPRSLYSPPVPDGPLKIPHYLELLPITLQVSIHVSPAKDKLGRRICSHRVCLSPQLVFSRRDSSHLH